MGTRSNKAEIRGRKDATSQEVAQPAGAAGMLRSYEALLCPGRNPAGILFRVSDAFFLYGRVIADGKFHSGLVAQDGELDIFLGDVVYVGPDVVSGNKGLYLVVDFEGDNLGIADDVHHIDLDFGEGGLGRGSVPCQQPVVLLDEAVSGFDGDAVDEVTIMEGIGDTCFEEHIFDGVAIEVIFFNSERRPQ